MATDFFRSMIADLDEPDTNVADENRASSDIATKSFIDTGSYIFNASLSGSLFGGLAGNRALLLAGPTAVGKSFLALGIVKSFLEYHKSGRVVYCDTESAISNELLTNLGIDVSRVAKSEPDTIERFRTVAVRILDAYAEHKDRFPLLMLLDSLSALSSSKELSDVTSGAPARDMTRAQVAKGAFRVLRLKLARLGVPLIVTAHTYQSIGGMFPTSIVAGGTGAQYSADQIVMLTKKKEKDNANNQIGNVVHIKLEKSRLSKEGLKVDTLIEFSGGLNRYYGLLQHAVDAGLVKKVSTRYQFPDGTKAFEKSINKSPEKFFTEPFLKDLDVYIQSKFQYTTNNAAPEDAAAANDTEDTADDAE